MTEILVRYCNILCFSQGYQGMRHSLWLNNGQMVPFRIQVIVISWSERNFHLLNVMEYSIMFVFPPTVESYSYLEKYLKTLMGHLCSIEIHCMLAILTWLNSHTQWLENQGSNREKVYSRGRILIK